MIVIESASDPKFHAETQSRARGIGELPAE